MFVPGHPVIQRPRAPPASRARRMSKSQAPDIATRTHEDIANGQYECVICTNEVLPNSRIWTCKTCWSVLHLSCVKKWSKNEVSTHQQRAVDNGEIPPPRQWRCPGCNLPKGDLPNNYTCWCEKEVDPKSIAGLPPILVARRVPRPGRVTVLIPVSFYAMLVLVDLVAIWDPHCHVSVARRCRQNDVWIQITIVDGAVGRYVGIYCLVESILVTGPAMRGFVEVASF